MNSNTATESSQLPVIAGHEITMDEHGRFNLNAIHKASEAGQSKRPSKWLANGPTLELIQELKNQSPQEGFAPTTVNHGGKHPGTFAHELLAVSYAGWISPRFQLQVNQVFLDYRMGKLESKARNPALPNPLTPDHQRGIQKAVARRAQALPKGLQRIAYSRLYSHLKDRFDVAKYDQIPDEHYTLALAAIETCELDGEWMPAPDEKPRHLDIDYPLSRWAEINHGLALDWQRQIPQGYKGRRVWFVRPSRLCGADHGSPTMMLLRELVDAGYNVEACQAEINAMRSTIDQLDSLQRRLSEIASGANSYPLIVQH